MDKFLIGLSFRQITMLATRLLGSHEVKASKESATQKKKKKKSPTPDLKKDWKSKYII